jgi:hypothetical protein
MDDVPPGAPADDLAASRARDTQWVEAALAGDQQAYIAGILAVLIGAALVFLVFPKPEKERELLEAYHAEDAGEGTTVVKPEEGLATS